MSQNVSAFRFFASERSYFSAKARPAFRAKRLYFEEVLPNRAAAREMRERTGGLFFLPTVVTPEGDTWQDTSDIIDALEARYPQPALIPATPLQRVAAYLIELYADEFMILPAMHYRWGTPEGERDARDSFAAATGDPAGAEKFADTMSGTLPFLGINEATRPAIVAHLEELLPLMEAVFAAQPFLLGEQMSLADCALLGPFYAHLYLDLVPGPLLRRGWPRISNWIERMNHPDVAAFAGFRAADALHEALRGMLALIGRDAAPVILDTVREFERWADTQPDGEHAPPRAVGFHTASLRGVAMERYTSSYTLWMLQRPLDAYAQLAPAQRAAVDAALAGSGCEELLAYRPRHRLRKQHFRLVCNRS